MHQMFRSMVFQMSGGSKHNDKTYRNHTELVCDDNTSLTVIRSDGLKNGFWKDAVNSDLAIFNSGAHVGKLNATNFVKELKRRNLMLKTRVVWVSAVPGHENCAQRIVPGPRSPFTSLHRWDEILGILPPEVYVLDAAAISDQRYIQHYIK
jgi:hypothetical protein